MGAIKRAIDQMMHKVNCWAAQREHQGGVIHFEWCICDLDNAELCLQVSPCVCFWDTVSAEQPGFTGVFSRLETNNTLSGLRNGTRIIDPNDVSRYVLVDGPL